MMEKINKLNTPKHMMIQKPNQTTINGKKYHFVFAGMVIDRPLAVEVIV